MIIGGNHYEVTVVMLSVSNGETLPKEWVCSCLLTPTSLERFPLLVQSQVETAAVAETLPNLSTVCSEPPLIIHVFR